MAKRNAPYVRFEEIPDNLRKHPFYGLSLDDEQCVFRDEIWNPNKLIVFCNAKAGTGKTLIASAVGNLLVKYGRYDGIVYIASPTQEQKQGYLAGSIQEKSEPYFEPFYQALERLGINLMTCFSDDIMNMKNGTSYIECTTCTFLRGVNFENKVIIIDEAQNFPAHELKKVLTRIHDSCKVIVIGHTGQIDLDKNGYDNGFVRCVELFQNDDRCAVCSLSHNYRGWVSSVADGL